VVKQIIFIKATPGGDMTDTAQKVMELFTRHGKSEPGMVIPSYDLTSNARKWGQNHFKKLQGAMEELQQEGHVIITPSGGLELTEEGYNYLFGEG
jgi:hypothetical protein